MTEHASCDAAGKCGQISEFPRRGYRVLICAANEDDGYEIYLAMAEMAGFTDYVTIACGIEELKSALQTVVYDLVICGDRHKPDDLELIGAAGREICDTGLINVRDAMACNGSDGVRDLLASLPGRVRVEMKSCSSGGCALSRTAQFVLGSGKDVPGLEEHLEYAVSCPLRREAEAGLSRARPND